jgi:hypothetical protein
MWAALSETAAARGTFSLRDERFFKLLHNFSYTTKHRRRGDRGGDVDAPAGVLERPRVSSTAGGLATGPRRGDARPSFASSSTATVRSSCSLAATAAAAAAVRAARQRSAWASLRAVRRASASTAGLGALVSSVSVSSSTRSLSSALPGNDAVEEANEAAAVELCGEHAGVSGLLQTSAWARKNFAGVKASQRCHDST